MQRPGGFAQPHHGALIPGEFLPPIAPFLKHSADPCGRESR